MCPGYGHIPAVRKSGKVHKPGAFRNPGFCVTLLRGRAPILGPHLSYGWGSLARPERKIPVSVAEVWRSKRQSCISIHEKRKGSGGSALPTETAGVRGRRGDPSRQPVCVNELLMICRRPKAGGTEGSGGSAPPTKTLKCITTTTTTY